MSEKAVINERQIIIEAITDEKKEPSELQSHLDNFFTFKRRTELLRHSPKDHKGRPTTYFRYMSKEMATHLLDQGSLTAADYHSDTVNSDDISNLSQNFYRIYRKRNSTNQFEKAAFLRLSLKEQAEIIFGKGQEFINLAVEGQNWSVFLDYINANLPLEEIKHLHSNHLGQRYSPFLGISSGGPIRSYIESYNVQIEMVLPLNQVTTHPNVGVKGEREVFVKKIELDHVTRMYVDTTTFLNETLFNPQTPIGQYYLQNKENMSPQTAFNKWRFDEPMYTTLPEELAKDYSW